MEHYSATDDACDPGHFMLFRRDLPQAAHRTPERDQSTEQTKSGTRERARSRMHAHTHTHVMFMTQVVRLQLTARAGSRELTVIW